MTRPAVIGKRKHRGLIEEAFFLDMALAEGQRALLAETSRLQQGQGRPDFSTLVRLLSGQSERLVRVHGVHQAMQQLVDRAPEEMGEDLQGQIDGLQASLTQLREAIEKGEADADTSASR